MELKQKKPREMHPGMWRYPRNDDLCCIYRVPNRIREVNPEAYTPQLVLIGPLHHSLKSQALKALDTGTDITYTKSKGYLDMEEHKKIYLDKFAARFQGRNIIDELKRNIAEVEEKIRACYSESTAWIQSTEFVDMVLHDSVFIVEFMLRCTTIGEAEGKKDIVMHDRCLTVTVQNDLILLENQLPYIILNQLFVPIFPIIGQNQTFTQLIMTFFNFQGVIRRELKHFTDLIRCDSVVVIPENDARGGKRMEHMHNAYKLENGGVKFEASVYVSFKNGCLKIPRLIVADSFEVKMRNVMALEQCHYPWNTHICNYILFLDYLIDTKKDVELLVQKGIIENCIGEPASIARMVNKLGIGTINYGSFYADIADEVNRYYSNPVNKARAVLMRVYFGDLWTGTATITASLLLAMTLIQTWASVGKEP